MQRHIARLTEKVRHAAQQHHVLRTPSVSGLGVGESEMEERTKHEGRISIMQYLIIEVILSFVASDQRASTGRRRH